MDSDGLQSGTWIPAMASTSTWSCVSIFTVLIDQTKSPTALQVKEVVTPSVVTTDSGDLRIVPSGGLSPRGELAPAVGILVASIL